MLSWWSMIMPRISKHQPRRATNDIFELQPQFGRKAGAVSRYMSDLNDGPQPRQVFTALSAAIGGQICGLDMQRLDLAELLHEKVDGSAHAGRNQSAVRIKQDYFS